MQGDWMMGEHDPARHIIIARAKELGITGDPDKPSHALGPVTLADGHTVNAHVIHAVDPIITDGVYVAMINRSNEPGKGRPALPGGFIDPAQGAGVESAVQAAVREAMEEIGVELGEGVRIGVRNMDRPYDIRVADGDIFLVSTQGVRFDVPDLTKTKLVAGDDAAPGSARCVAINSITRQSVGIPDHADMIHEAMRTASIKGPEFGP